MHKMFQTYVSEQLPSTQRNSPRIHHLYGELQENGGMSHRNPITKSKYKQEERKANILTRSEVSQPNSGAPLRSNLMNTNPSSREKSEQAFCDITHFHNIQPDRTYKAYTKSLEGKLEEVLQRVEKNEKQIEKLAKICHKQNHTLKILSDFKEIKDVYAVIRDHKTMQNQFNLKISEQVNHIKQSLPILKQQMEKMCRNCQSNASRYQNCIKQVQKSLWHELQKRILSNSHHKQESNNLGIVQQLKNNTNELKLKLAKLQQRYSLQPPLGLTQIKHTSLSSIQSSQSIPVTVSQSLQTKVGSIHNISKCVYYVDKNGYLLDDNKYYLLDDKDQLIKVQEQQWQKLRSICSVVETSI